MHQYKNDEAYHNIVRNILENKEFNKIRSIEHHGISRMDHSIRVSYYSYKIAKICKLNSEEVARGGLLHDFFLSPEDRDLKEKFISTFTHPKKAEQNATLIFDINEKEADIIKSHMFPVNLTLPKYAESWVVNLVDKGVGIYEFMRKFGYKLSYIANVYLIFLYNSMR